MGNETNQEHAPTEQTAPEARIADLEARLALANQANAALVKYMLAVSDAQMTQAAQIRRDLLPTRGPG